MHRKVLQDGSVPDLWPHRRRLGAGAAAVRQLRRAWRRILSLVLCELDLHLSVAHPNAVELTHAVLSVLEGVELLPGVG